MREKKGGALQKLKKRLSHSFGRLSEYRNCNWTKAIDYTTNYGHTQYLLLKKSGKQTKAKGNNNNKSGNKSQTINGNKKKKRERELWQKHRQICVGAVAAPNTMEYVCRYTDIYKQYIQYIRYIYIYIMPTMGTHKLVYCAMGKCCEASLWIIASCKLAIINWVAGKVSYKAIKF